MQIVEVIKTSTAFQPIEDPKNPDRGFLPLGAIEYKRLGDGTTETGTGANSFTRYALPFNPNIQQIPLIGEHVFVVNAFSGFASKGFSNDKQEYYMSPICIHGSVHANPLPNHTENTVRGKGIDGSKQDNTGEPDWEPGLQFIEAGDVRKLQPFEGDVIFEGRHGQGLRFSTAYLEDPNDDGNATAQYAQQATWEADFYSNDGTPPITILSNGFNNAPSEDTYRIESPNNTDSIVMLTSAHKILDFTPSQKFEPGIPIAEYIYPQVIISSERLHFNSKENNIIMTAKEDVILATPDWSTQINELLNILDEFMEEVKKLTNQEATFATGAGPTGLATNNAQIKALLDRLRKMKQ